MSLVSSRDSQLAVLFLAVLAVLLFADAFWGNRTLVPTGFLYLNEPWISDPSASSPDPAQQYDLLYQFYPWARFFKESLSQGIFPLWNPYTYLGTPFLANPQTALLFPLTWIHLLMPLSVSFTFVFILKLAAALTGMFLWLRAQGLRVFPCLVGALVFGLSMHTVVSLAFPYASVTALFPWALLSMKRLLDQPSSWRWLQASVVLSLTYLAGQPQSALPAFCAVAAYAATYCRTCPKHRLSRMSLALSCFLAAGMWTAIQWLPSVEYVMESMITEGPRIIRSGYPYSPGCFLNFLIPDFFGSHLEGDFWGFPGYHDIAFYSSVSAVVLAGLCRFRIRDQRLSYTTFCTVLAAAAWSLLLGLPVLETLLDLPGFDLIRRNKLVFLLVFSLASLSAVSLDYLQDRRRAPTLRLVLCFLFVLVVSVAGICWFADYLEELDPHHRVDCALARSILLLLALVLSLRFLPTSWLGPTVFSLVLLDLLPLSYTLNPRGNSDWLYRRPALLDSLANEQPAIYGLSNILFPNSAMVFKIQDVRGYDVMTPRRLFRYMQKIDPDLGNVYDWLMKKNPDKIHRDTRMRRIIGYWLDIYGKSLTDYLKRNSYWSVGVGQIKSPQFFQALHVDYLLSLGLETVPGYELLPSGTPQVQMYSRLNKKRAKVYQNWESTEPSSVLERMQEVELDKTVLIEADLAPPSRHSSGANKFGQRALVVDRSAESCSVLVETNRDAVLVLFERYNDGWKAHLDDGRELEVFPANFLFRGVAVPEGRHTVTFTYRPFGFRLGLCIGAIGLIGTIAILLKRPPFLFVM